MVFQCTIHCVFNQLEMVSFQDLVVDSIIYQKKNNQTNNNVDIYYVFLISGVFIRFEKTLQHFKSRLILSGELNDNKNLKKSHLEFGV